MKAKFFNPLTIFVSILLLVIAILLGWWGKGASVGELFTILFTPFLFDVSKGVGESGSQAFHLITSTTSTVLFILLLLSLFVKKTASKLLVYGFGIILSLAHFVIVGAGYFSTGLH